MRIIIQRVSEAAVTTAQKTVGKIGRGFLVFLGIHKEDHARFIQPLVDRMINLRIFDDEKGKMNLSLLDVQGELIIVSQFTLYANCRSGRRPSFSDCAPPEQAKNLYQEFIDDTKRKVSHVETGEFGALMHVHLINEGPVTILLEES